MEAKKERCSSSHAVYLLRYHILFCPKETVRKYIETQKEK